MADKNQAENASDIIPPLSSDSQATKNALHSWFDYLLIPLLGLITPLSILILAISTPPVWQKIYDTAMPENMHSIYREDAKRISDGFWQDKSYEQIASELNSNKYDQRLIPKTSSFRPLSEKEIVHFEDVKRLVHFFFYPAILGLLVLSAWMIWLKRRVLWHISLAYLVLFGGILGLWGLIAWRHMFRTLHWWIFQDDSWILADNAYTLMLFPYSVWQTASVVVLVTLIIILLSLSLPEMLRAIKRLKSNRAPE